MSITSDFVWTPERVELLTTLHADGLSFGQIAKRFSGVSRAACLGKARRMGLTRSEILNAANKSENGRRNAKVATAARVEAAKERALKAPAVTSTKRGNGASARWSGKKAVETGKALLKVAGGGAIFEGTTHTAPLPNRPELEPLVGSLCELGAHQCKWPIGDQDFRFCGRERAGEQPYCADHVRRAFNPLATRNWDSHGRRRVA